IAFAVLEAIVEQFGADALVRRGNPSPRHVKRAEEFMREHLSAQLDLGKLAEVSGVSSRTLQRGFQQFRGTSAVQIFKDRRLHRAREWLTDAREQRSLKQIAADVGFTPYATFWRSYSHRYGESPSDTHFRTIRERWMKESKAPGEEPPKTS